MQTKSGKGKECLIIGLLSMFLTVGLSHAQFEIWTYTNGATSTANALVYGTNNSIYTAGYINMGTTANDFAMVGLDNAGNETFVYTHDGPGGTFANDDKANAIVYGIDGNIYATGFVSVTGGTYDLCLASLNGSGTERWLVEIGNPSGTSDEGKAIAFGTDNNIYVAGYSDVGGPGVPDFVVLKYSTQGNFRWYYAFVGSDTGTANAITYGAIVKNPPRKPLDQNLTSVIIQQLNFRIAYGNLT